MKPPPRKRKASWRRAVEQNTPPESGGTCGGESPTSAPPVCRPPATTCGGAKRGTRALTAAAAGFNRAHRAALGRDTSSGLASAKLRALRATCGGAERGTRALTAAAAGFNRAHRAALGRDTSSGLASAKLRALRALQEENPRAVPPVVASTPIRATASAECYYYTVSEPTAVEKRGVWMLRVNWQNHFQNVKNKMQRAETSASRFQTPNFPKYYATEQESLANATEFRRHVEDVVRGNQPQLRHVSVAVSEQTLTIQLENQNRSARLICRSVRRQRD